MENNNEEILVKLNENKLICIDPNTVINNGNIEPRNVKQENLVMYVNLEADLIPRTTYISDTNKSQLLSVSKGVLNMLNNKNGTDLDTSWTESFYSTKPEDTTSQNFGITSVNINILGGSFIPRVTITFVDVRGKTLFDSPENSPYSAFFHLPWPIFYLTVKGYYGKAIKYRLHLSSFSSKFNDSTGNFDVTATFVGSTYAYLTNIPLMGMLNSPYMYLISNDTTGEYNEQTQSVVKKISNSSKGFRILKNIYKDYISKGYLPKNFPMKTLRDIITKAKSIDRILEREIFDQLVDTRLFSGLNELEKNINDFLISINSWSTINLVEEFFTDGGKSYFYLNKKHKDDQIIVGEATSSLKTIITNYSKLLNDNKIFTEKIINNTSSKFTTKTIKIDSVNDVQKYYKTNEGKFGVSIEEIINDIQIILNSFNKQKNLLQDEVEKKINEIFKDKEKGLGFEPTIRNIFGLIMAHADLFIKLLKEVHEKAINVGEVRKRLLTNYSKETIDNDNIYPWPQIIKKTQTKENIITYPGDKDLRGPLQSNNYTIWPEIEFLENYHAIATKKLDTLSQKETGASNVTYIFEEENNKNYTLNSTLLSLHKYGFYNDSLFSKLLYEIYERGKFITLYDNFSNKTILELANNEYENLKQIIENDYDIKKTLSKVNSIESFLNLLKNTSESNYQYLIDNYYTLSYLNDLEENSFKIEFNNQSEQLYDFDNSYVDLKTELIDYKIDEYRKKSFPFSSPLYLSYIKKDKIDDDLKFNNNFKIDTTEGLIVTNKDYIKSWVKNDYRENIFSQNLKFNDSLQNCNILNTPYFHNQLLNDYEKQSNYNRYAGSSYLLLNSLPFYDLNDTITLSGGTSIRMSTLFKEIGSTHFVPYFLILKWGSIYHRYKTYIKNGYDILSGFTDNNITKKINGLNFYDKNKNGSTVYNGVKYNDNNLAGFYPYYDSIYNNIINNESLFNTENPTEYNNLINSKNLLLKKDTRNNINYYTKILNNKNINTNNDFFTLLPSNGLDYEIKSGDYDIIEQNNYKLIWENSSVNIEFDNLQYPSYNQYHKTLDEKYKISNDYVKIIDLISVFSPKILDEFEKIFISFSNNDEKNNLQYGTFKSILKEISTIKNVNNYNVDNLTFFNDIKNKQKSNIIELSNKLLSDDYLVKLTIGNPKEINSHIWSSFCELNKNIKKSYNKYYSSQYNQTNIKLLKLYLGDEPIENCYLNFFINNDIELNEENIINFRPLIYLYAGFIHSNENGSFKDFIKQNVFTGDKKFNKRFDTYLNHIISKFPSLGKEETNKILTFNEGYNENPLKVEQYSYFKEFNDRWIAGNSIGQKSLIEEFLFLDVANNDIGNKLYFDITKLINLDSDEYKDKDLYLYDVISILLEKSNIDFRPLPAYVNFYGYNNTTNTITASEKVSKNLFGTFLDIDYEDSSPKMVLQYVGPYSNYLNMSDIENSKNLFKFNNDSFDISNRVNNGIISQTVEDEKLSNKVVAFDVSIGDSNQNMFKSITVDQSNFKNTTESYRAQDELGRTESGSASHQIDVGLFNIYRNYSYTCHVNSLGNAMIQPTMYFYLKNVPLFRGTYWITEVTHNIKPGSFETTFKGVRIPYFSLEKQKDYFMASYRILFDKMVNKANIIQKNKDVKTSTQQQIVTDNPPNSTFTIDTSEAKVDGEIVLKEAGQNIYGVDYNGFNEAKNLLKVRNTSKSIDGSDIFYRGIVTIIGSDKSPVKIDDDYNLNILNYIENITVNSGVNERKNNITWGDVKNSNEYFYGLDFNVNNMTYRPQGNQIFSSSITFYNPNNINNNVTISKLDTDEITPTNIKGPILLGPKTDGYSVMISTNLARKLELSEKSVIYFRMT